MPEPAQVAPQLQATVMSFDPADRSGTMVTDDGVVIAFAESAFLAGGLRLLRRGQRVRAVRSASGEVLLVTVLTLAVD